MIIDATDRFLVPGLTDMHIHLTCNTGLECRNDLFLFLANGVTTVRSMWGSAFELRVRDEIEAGQTLGPTLFVASPGMDGPGGSFESFTPLITSASEARLVARQHANAGYDFLKVYNTLTDDMYVAILDEAEVHDIPVVGHKPFGVRFDRLTELGHWTSEHLLDYEQEASPTGSIWSSDANLEQVRVLAGQGAAAGLAETITAAAFWSIRSEVPSYQSSPEARYASPGIWEFSSNWLNGWQATQAQRADRFRRQRSITAILHESGVPLLLGTDAGVRWVFPGSSIHFELEEMVASALSPYEALVTGTLNAARYLGADDLSGTVQVGARADLVLLERNPLDDVANFASQVGVMVRGVWMEHGAIQERLADIAQSYGR